jgi:hypothetical protein
MKSVWFELGFEFQCAFGLGYGYLLGFKFRFVFGLTLGIGFGLDYLDMVEKLWKRISGERRNL